jgi:tetratricopeptide (TPR) repeat protein
VFVTASASVWKEAVNLPFRIGNRQSLLVLPILLLTLVPGTAFGQRTNSQPPSVAKKVPASSPSAVSPEDELLRRIQAQRAAVAGGDATAVEHASRQVAALVFRQMAGLRALQGAWPRSVELYQQSLDLEDIAGVRVDLAMAYMSANQPDSAVQEADKALAADPKNARAWHVKGKALMAKDDYKGAVDALTHAAELNRDVNVQYALAFSLLKMKEKAKAEAIFNRMLQSYGDRAIWHEVFGGAYRDTKYLDDSVREFKRAIELDPSLPHIHAFLGAILLEQNYWAPNPEILQEFGDEVKAYPKGYYGNFYLGVLLSQQDQLAEADRYLKVAAEADPQNPDPWLYLGLSAFKSRDNAAAKTYLLKAVELTGADQARANYQIRRGYIALGRILASEGNKQDAQVYLQKAKDLSAKSLALSSSAIASEMAEGSTDAPPAVITSANLPATDIPESPIGQLEQPMPDKPHLTPEQTQAIEKREKELRSVLGTSFNDWGTAEARQKDYASALGHFHEAEKWDASTPGLMRNIGLAALKVGDDKEAVRALQAAAQKDPNDHLANAMLGMSLFSKQQFAEAAKAFATLGDDVYRDPRTAYAWAFCLVHTNEPTKAVEILNRLISQALPTDMLVGVGDLYSQTLDYDDALKTFQKAIQQDPSAPRVHYYAGEALIHLDRPNEAIPEFQAELKLTPDDPNVQYHLAFAMLQTSHKDEAVALLQTIVAAHPDHAQAQYQLGKAQLDAGQYQPAVEHLEAAARLDPNKDYIHYQLQSAYRKVGRSSDADAELKIYREIKEKKREASNSQPRQ